MIFFERRRHQRVGNFKGVEFIKVSDHKEIINYGKLVDLCRGGVGIETDFILLQGQPVILRGVSDGEELVYGVVVWCKRQGELYRSGIRFILEDFSNHISCIYNSYPR